MRYLFLLLLLAGCVDQPVKADSDAAKLAKEQADRKRCDQLVDGPRDSDAYQKCLTYD